MKEILIWLLPFLFEEKPMPINLSEVISIEILNDFDIQNGVEMRRKTHIRILTKQQIETFVKAWNTSKWAGKSKFVSHYGLKIHLKNGEELFFRCQKDKIQNHVSNNTFAVDDADFFKHLFENALR